VEGRGAQDDVEDSVTRRHNLYCFPNVFAVMKSRMVKRTNVWNA